MGGWGWCWESGGGEVVVDGGGGGVVVDGWGWLGMGGGVNGGVGRVDGKKGGSVRF